MDIFPLVAEVIRNCLDMDDSICSIIGSLRRLVRSPPHFLAILPSSPDFGLLLGASPPVAAASIRLILELVPSIGAPFSGIGDVPDHTLPQTPDSLPFYTNLLPVLEDYIKSADNPSELALLAIGSILKVTRSTVNPALYQYLIRFSTSERSAPAVMYVIANAGEDDFVARTGVFHALKSAVITEGPVSQWYYESLAALEARVAPFFRDFAMLLQCDSLTDFLAFMVCFPVSPFAFEGVGLLDASMRLLQSHDRRVGVHLQALADVAVGLLELAPLPEIYNFFPGRAPDSFAKQQLRWNLLVDGNMIRDISIPHFSAFVAIEALMNERQGITTAVLSEAFPDLSRGRIENLTITERGFLYRKAAPEGYIRYSFRVNGVVYSALDSTYHTFTRSLPKQDAYPSTFLTIELIPEVGGAGRLQGVSAMREQQFDDRLNKLLKFAELIHEVDPQAKLLCRPLEDRIAPHTQGFYPFVGMFSPLLNIVFGHPYLFSISLKSRMFRLSSLDMYSALSYAHFSIMGGESKFREGRSFWSPIIHRDNVLSDGIALLREFGPGPMHLDAQFEGEPGFGAGPTRELFDLLAKELSKVSLNIWRHNSAKAGKKSEYAFTEVGLFPRPDADPELFYVIGLLCGKALAMDITLPLPLSDAFLKRVTNQPLTIGMVDATYAKVLENKDDLVGLDFVYPGIETLELVPNGADREVTSANVDEYVKLIVDFTIGSKLDKIVERFTDGFHSVVERGLWERLSPADMKALIMGEEAVLTVEELDKCVKFQHGYGPNSPQKAMLFETILGLDDDDRMKFFQFVTGCERLPIGGLSALHPKITVARRSPDDGADPDEALPTVATCTNYFKLPPYSSQIVMKQKILTAILEGQGEFGLS
jgi:hypothetical protein